MWLLGAFLSNFYKAAKADSHHSGARGLGYSMAQACAEAGAKALIILDANQQLGEDAVASLHALTGDTVPVAFYNVDVRDENAINESINALVKAYGVPDVLINSAGIAE